ncbi:MAG: LegC family aminotransferase [Gemmatimonadales bacterium]|nr:LegC family aminotransferase [Gemmatimonadales bacterium]
MRCETSRPLAPDGATRDDLCLRVIEAIRSACADRAAAKTLHEPVFGGNEGDYLLECIRTGWVSSVGPFVDRFESELAAFTGARRAVAVVNGTAALHVCLQLAGVEREDEVLVPALTFVGTVNAIVYCGAIPHFADSGEQTLGLDPEKLAEYLAGIVDPGPDGPRNRVTGRVIRAVVPMHTYGHPVDLDQLQAVCERFGLVMVEDAAESIGSYYKGVHTGNTGRLSALSFNGNKALTTGGGGAILTNDEALGGLAKHLTTTARIPHRWAFQHDMVGYNYRMPNINAALGCAQLEQLPGFIAAKRALAVRYADAFRDIPGVRIFEEPPFGRSNYWLNALLLDADLEHRRDDLLESTNAAGFATRPTWTLMHRLPMYSSSPRMDLTTAESLERRLINLPSGVRVAVAS